MLYESFELHNVTQVKVLPGYPGRSLLRLPYDVRLCMNTDVADLCRGVEIRFFVEPEQPALQGGRIYLAARDTDGEAVVFWGDYQDNDVVPLPKGVVTPVRVAFPGVLDRMPAGRFPNRLCRVFLNNRSAVQFVGYEYLNVRPPRGDEMPARTLVGYGSSITHGGVARSNCMCYLELAARHLGMDALNLGFSGSCHADPALADYLAERVQGDVFFIELGANMINHFDAAEFKRRALYTLRRVAQAHSSAFIFATGLYKGCWDAEKRRAFNEAVARCVQTLALPNLYFLPPDDLMPDASGLIMDGIHPSDYGHVVIAWNLAHMIAERTGKR